jgi:hypothetical protein
MTDAVQVALIITVPSSVLSALTLFLSWRNGHKVEKATEKVAELHVAVDGRLTQLLSANSDAAEARGKLLEKERSKIEHANILAGVAQEKERGIK